MDSKLRNTLAYSSGSSNVAFYGVPAVLILFGEEFLPIILMSMICYIVYDSTVGYFIISEQKFSLRQIFTKLIKFPPFIAIMAGFVVYLMPFDPSFNRSYNFVVNSRQTTMATLGIFLIGLLLSI